MIGRNIKKYRLLAGLSLRDMGDKLNVSHQTIKKYENDEMTPNSARLIDIAKLFGIKTSDLFSTFDIPTLQFRNFRKRTTMTKKKEKGLFMLISDEIAKYIEVLELANEKYSFDRKKWTFDIEKIEDIENIAVEVRRKLGVSDMCALDNLTDKLEDNNFLILSINYDEKFDGFCEYVDGLAFIILSSIGYERNRFTLAHELGHLILNFKEELSSTEIEKYCDEFASSLLMPKKAMIREMEFNGKEGIRNTSINELLLIAKEYKVSLNAVIMRLYNLNIIDENQKRNLFIFLTKIGAKNKQLKIVDEHPTREKKLIYRLEAEKIISSDEAIKYLGVTTDEYFKSDFSN